MIKLIKKFVAHILHYISCVRVTIAPNLFLKAEQFWHEIGIEEMHKHPGYAAFSAMLRAYIPPGARVLDLGCNKGLETKIISRTNSVVGIDVYLFFIKIEKKRGVDARVMDFHNLKFSEEFDCVYSNSSLEHAKYPEKVIKGVYKALKLGGIFIIGMPLDGYNLRIKDPAHFFRAKEDDVVLLLERNKFRIVHKEVIDTKQKWNWEIPPSLNKMLLCVAKKSR